MLRKILGFLFDSVMIYIILWMVFSLCEVVVPVWVTLFFTFIIAGIINDDLDSGDDSDDNIATDLGL